MIDRERNRSSGLGEWINSVMSPHKNTQNNLSDQDRIKRYQRDQFKKGRNKWK